jgi:hypothetical protein
LFFKTFLISLPLLAIATSATAAKKTSIDPTTGWANTFLLNSVFAADYEAFMRGTKNSEENKKELLNSEAAANSFIRSKFALNSAKTKRQAIKRSSTITTFQMGHAGFLASFFKSDDPRKEFLFISKNPKTSIETISGTFSTKKYRGFWNNLAQSYEQSSPSCPIKLKEIKSFAAHQKSLTSDNRGANATALIEPIKKWPKGKVRCLILAMMSASDDNKKTQGLEPLHLLNAMVHTGSEFAKDPAIRSMFAIRLLQLNRYAETLRVLMNLQDTNIAYRLPYEIVQRIYSRTQKGQGQVALKGI